MSNAPTQKAPNTKQKQKCKNCEGQGLLKKGDKVVPCQMHQGTGRRARWCVEAAGTADAYLGGMSVAGTARVVEGVARRLGIGHTLPASAGVPGTGFAVQPGS